MNSATLSLFRWVFLTELLVEVTLAVIAFLAVLEVFQPRSLAWLVTEVLMFVINLALWLSIAFCCTPRVSTRGDSLFRADFVYFAITSGIHFLLATGWVIYEIKFSDASPLTWAANPRAVSVQRHLFTWQVLLVAALVLFSVFEARYARIREKMTARKGVRC